MFVSFLNFLPPTVAKVRIDVIMAECDTKITKAKLLKQFIADIKGKREGEALDFALRNFNGFCALATACRMQCRFLAISLINAGWNVNEKDVRGRQGSVIDMALGGYDRRNADIVRLLLSKGADPWVENKYGFYTF